jgi:hypothetical protein
MFVLVAARSAVGEWLSLVEHLVRDQGVGGSNPLSPTNLFGFSSKIPLRMHSEYPPLQKTQGWGSLIRGDSQA